ncbi:MAG TPA: FtsQ-type POTRA domain-containing protein [Nocardioidaceae bacterium]|nr:FtsQ-type POTRA domain-containing protein [Nocardioidaceae bacterium]
MTERDQDNVSRLPRRRLVERLPSRRVVVSALALVLVTLAAWIVYFSTWLAADEISVSGADTISADDVRAVAAVSMGTPLARLDIERIQQRVAEIPEVREVDVRRKWPHTVAIAIIEREPVAALRREGIWWSVDKDGELFAGGPQRPERWPPLSVPTTAGEEALQETARVAAALPADLRRTTVRLSAESMDSITVHLKGARTVVWGSAADSERKVEVLRALLKQATSATYDVSVPEQPTAG